MYTHTHHHHHHHLMEALAPPRFKQQIRGPEKCDTLKLKDALSTPLAFKAEYKSLNLVAKIQNIFSCFM